MWTATQAFINDGEVTNIATVSTEFAAATTNSNIDSVTVPAVQNPELTIEKSLVAPFPAGFDEDEVLNYSYVVTNNGNVTIAGPIPHAEVVAAFSPALSRLPRGQRPRFQRTPRVPQRPSVGLYTHETEQTHLAMGFHAWGRSDDRRFALKLLSVVLGGIVWHVLIRPAEERDLTARFGDEYVAYCLRVRCWWPRISIRD